jgi:hypothetical protein
MKEYDEKVVAYCWEKHVDGFISVLKYSLEGKTIRDFQISPYSDIDIYVSDDISIQAFDSFPSFVGEEAYGFEKYC